MKTGRMNESTLSGRMPQVLALLAIMAVLCGTAYSETFIKETPDAHTSEKHMVAGGRTGVTPKLALDTLEVGDIAKDIAEDVLDNVKNIILSYKMASSDGLINNEMHTTEGQGIWKKDFSFGNFFAKPFKAIIRGFANIVPKMASLDTRIDNEKLTTEGNGIAMKPFVADDLERSMNDDLENKQPYNKKHTVAGRRKRGWGRRSRRSRRSRRHIRNYPNPLTSISNMLKGVIHRPIHNDYEVLNTEGTGIMNTPFVADDLQRSEDGFTENVHQNDEKHAVAGARTGVKPRHAPHAIGAGVRPNTAAKHVAIYADKNGAMDVLKDTLNKVKDFVLDTFDKAVDKAFSYINSL